MEKIQYIFWDSDDTLVNTGEHHWRKHFESLKLLGLHLDDKWRPRIASNNGAQNWEWINAELGLELPDEPYLDLVDTWYYQHIQEIDIRAGVLDAIKLFTEAGCKQAVVSNGRRRSVMAALNAKELVPHFNFILCKEDYEGRKPGPEPYLAALKKMQRVVGNLIDPQTCLVIEDAPEGVESGRAAGMHVIDRPVRDDDVQAFLAQCRSHLT